MSGILRIAAWQVRKGFGFQTISVLIKGELAWKLTKKVCKLILHYEKVPCEILLDCTKVPVKQTFITQPWMS